MVDNKQLTDGSPIEDNFDTLEGIQEYLQDSQHTRMDFSKMALQILTKSQTKKKVIVLCSIDLKQVETVRKKFDQQLMKNNILLCNSK